MIAGPHAAASHAPCRALGYREGTNATRSLVPARKDASGWASASRSPMKWSYQVDGGEGAWSNGGGMWRVRFSLVSSSWGLPPSPAGVWTGSACSRRRVRDGVLDADEQSPHWCVKSKRSWSCHPVRRHVAWLNLIFFLFLPISWERQNVCSRRILLSTYLVEFWSNFIVSCCRQCTVRFSCTSSSVSRKSGVLCFCMKR